jgi:hypothetical protein
VDYSERTAQMLMSAYERFGTGQQKLFGKTADPELVAQLNRSQIFALMSIMPVFQGFILETRLDSLIPLINKDF